MATNTTNYNLKKPEPTDFYTIQDANDNMDSIDACLKTNADALASHGADAAKHIPKVAAGGSANAYTASVSGVTAYTDGFALLINIPATNTGAATLNINSLGAKNIRTAALGNLPASALYANAWYLLAYHGTYGCFVVLSRHYNDADTASTQLFSNKTLDSSNILSVSDKTAVADADAIALADSADNNKIKKLPWSSAKTNLRTYFNGLYAALTHSHAQSEVTGLTSDLANKVDKVTGKGLSTEDYTTAEKNKLAGVAVGATANSTDATLLSRANHTGTQAASTITGLATVATSGSYNDLSNKPSIPTALTKATQAEVEAGTEDTHYMTALKTKQAINSRCDDMLLWELIQSYTTAGAYNFVAPDRFSDGRSYEIGIYIIGGGGSGGASKVEHLASYGINGVTSGGASGYVKIKHIRVTPGVGYAIVIGAGGIAAITATTINQLVAQGVAGGSSSFDADVANGGDGGRAGTARTSGQYATANGADGGQGSDGVYVRLPRTTAPVGSTPIANMDTYGAANAGSSQLNITNPFDLSCNLGAGGAAQAAIETSNSCSGDVQTASTLPNGYKAGSGVWADGNTDSNINAIGEDATSPGCGGGGAVLTSGLSGNYAKSGKGADGAVYIYARRLS